LKVKKRSYRPPVEEWATRTLARPTEYDYQEQVESVLPRPIWTEDQEDNTVEIPQPYYRRNYPPEETYEQPAYVRTIPEDGDLRGHPWKGKVQERRTMTAGWYEAGDALFEDPPLDYGYYAMIEEEEDLDKEGREKYSPRGRPDERYLVWRRSPAGRRYYKERSEGGPRFREYQKQQREWRRKNPRYHEEYNKSRRKYASESDRVLVARHLYLNDLESF